MARRASVGGYPGGVVAALRDLACVAGNLERAPLDPECIERLAETVVTAREFRRIA